MRFKSKKSGYLLWFFLGGLVCFFAAGCLPETQEVPTATPSLSSSDTNTPPPAKIQPLNSSPGPVSPSTTAPKTVSVTLYRADSNCQTFVGENVKVAANNSVDEALGKIIKRYNSGDFEIVGYRVNVDKENALATVDFRLAPNSKRQFVSLSSCEQFALFGSIKKTLLNNPVWQIKDVRFTNQGKDIDI